MTMTTEVQLRDKCDACGGSGFFSDGPWNAKLNQYTPRECQSCNGTGYSDPVWYSLRDLIGHLLSGIGEP